MYEAVKRYVENAEHVAAVVGRGEEFTFLNLTGGISDDERTLANQKGFTLCGVVGLTGGVVGTASVSHPDTLRTMVHAGLVFATAVANQRARAGVSSVVPDEGDSLSWLRALYALSDTREDRQ